MSNWGKTTLLKKRDPQIWLCLIMLLRITLFKTAQQLDCDRNIELALWPRGYESVCGVNIL